MALVANVNSGGKKKFKPSFFNPMVEKTALQKRLKPGDEYMGKVSDLSILKSIFVDKEKDMSTFNRTIKQARLEAVYGK